MKASLGVMSKSHILDEIRRTAQNNGGAPLGLNRFHSETGIKKSDWYGKYWVRWGDALREAGFPPNTFNSKALSDEQLFEKLIGLIRELGRYPVSGELGLKRASDPSFPVEDVFKRRFGGRRELVIERLVTYCSGRLGYEDVLAICRPFERQVADVTDATPRSAEHVGFVYLFKSGRYYKIGRTNAVGRREYEVGIQLPEKMALVHSIKTDDPGGIEVYWHRRFQDRRKQGEWFALTPDDLSAFRRRKFM